jgi:pimeloyl-ACP methyl ester carboxylesterase
MSRTASGLTYGPSVHARSQSSPTGGWDQKIRLYADGLLRRPWTPSYEDGQDKASQLADAILPDDSSWKFKCPVSIIFGLKDIALDPRVVLDGIEDHFLPESDDPLQASVLAKARITRLPNCGHWSVLEDEGVEALEMVLSRICSDKQPGS